MAAYSEGARSSCCAVTAGGVASSGKAQRLYELDVTEREDDERQEYGENEIDPEINVFWHRVSPNGPRHDEIVHSSVLRLQMFDAGEKIARHIEQNGEKYNTTRARTTKLESNDSTGLERMTNGQISGRSHHHSQPRAAHYERVEHRVAVG